MEDIKKLWEAYNHSTNEISEALGRTNNIVGEYAEYLTCNYYNGELLPSSHPSADVKDKNNKLYQVKSRKLKNKQATRLGIIRSWDFDFLIVILFEKNGRLYKALEVPVQIAKKYARHNQHENGAAITTSQNFLMDTSSKNITNDFE